MYMDAVVLAGIATVLLMVVFFIGVGIFVMRDQKAHGSHQASKTIENNREVA